MYAQKQNGKGMKNDPSLASTKGEEAGEKVRPEVPWAIKKTHKGIIKVCSPFKFVIYTGTGTKMAGGKPAERGAPEATISAPAVSYKTQNYPRPRTNTIKIISISYNKK